MVTAAELRELSLQLPTAPLGLVMPSTSHIFKMDEDAKAVEIDARDLTRIMRIGCQFVPQIGKQAHRLPPMQQGDICVEPGRNTKRLPSSR
jgi:hypothetical protein